MQWQMSRLITLSLSVEASASRLTERFGDGSARERWRPFYSASLGVAGTVK
jgi:hypothetical protein